MAIRHTLHDKVVCEGNSFVVTVNEVSGMIAKLNPHKADGRRGTYSDNFIHAPLTCIVKLTMPINVMLSHGHVAD